MENIKVNDEIEVLAEIPKEKEEIVVQDNNELVNYNFTRVDLEDPKSILSYGQTVQDNIIAILESTAEMSVNQEESFIDDEMLKKITSFDEALEQADKEAAKEEGLITRFTKSIARMVGSKKVEKEDEMKTYKGRYQDYVENIRKVIEKVEVLKQNALNDIELRKEIAVQMRPFIDELEMMVAVGKQDKAEYDQETLEISKTDQSVDGQYLVQRRSRISDIFAEKLNKLEKAVILYKGQLQEYAIQQQNDMIVVMNADSYQRDQAPLLEVQGSTQVFNKLQSARISNLQTLNDASNVAIQNNARNLETNTKAAVDLMVNGGFTTDTLQAVEKSLQEGINIIKKGKADLKQKVEKDQKTLAEINQLLDQNEKDIIELIEGTAKAIGENEGHGSYTKTISSRRPFGKK